MSLAEWSQLTWKLSVLTSLERRFKGPGTGARERERQFSFLFFIFFFFYLVFHLHTGHFLKWRWFNNVWLYYNNFILTFSFSIKLFWYLPRVLHCFFPPYVSTTILIVLFLVDFFLFHFYLLYCICVSSWAAVASEFPQCGIDKVYVV